MSSPEYMAPTQANMLLKSMRESKIKCVFKMVPRSQQAVSDLTALGYNPKLQLTLPLNKTLGRVIEYLAQRWSNPHTGGSVATSPFLLWPEDVTPGGYIVRLPIDASSVTSTGMPISVGDVLAARNASLGNAPHLQRLAVTIAYDWERSTGIPPAMPRHGAADSSANASSGMRRIDSSYSAASDADLDLDHNETGIPTSSPSPPSSSLGGTPTPPVARAFTTLHMAAPVYLPASAPAPVLAPAPAHAATALAATASAENLYGSRPQQPLAPPRRPAATSKARPARPTAAAAAARPVVPAPMSTPAAPARPPPTQRVRVTVIDGSAPRPRFVASQRPGAGADNDTAAAAAYDDVLLSGTAPSVPVSAVFYSMGVRAPAPAPPSEHSMDALIDVSSLPQAAHVAGPPASATAASSQRSLASDSLSAALPTDEYSMTAFSEMLGRVAPASPYKLPPATSEYHLGGGLHSMDGLGGEYSASGYAVSSRDVFGPGPSSSSSSASQSKAPTRFFSGIENSPGLISPPQSASKRHTSSSSSDGAAASGDPSRSPVKRRLPLSNLGLDDVLMPAGDASVGGTDW